MRAGDVLVALLVASLAGCATLECRPERVVAAEREERTRPASDFRGVRTDELGRVREVRRDRLATEWWIRDTQGHWHPVDEATYRAAEPGHAVSVCP